MAKPVSLAQLIARGDHVAIEKGLLTIRPASGNPVPPEWLKEHGKRLVIEAAQQTESLALEYRTYSVGNYGERRAGGITLQLVCLSTGQEIYTIFNAITKRQRTTKDGKKGDPLPKGHFAVRKGFDFAKFWIATGLHYQRLANLHQRMGNLSDRIYTGTLGREKNRLIASSLRPLEISPQQLGCMTNKSQTNHKQLTNKPQTLTANNKTQQRQQSQGFATFSGTGADPYGKTVIRERGNTESPTPSLSSSNDEWLQDYENTAPLIYSSKASVQ